MQKRNVAIEEELQLAREIQQALLPKEVDGLILQDNEREVTVGCRYCPASEMAGDFFEVIPISQHCMGILLCDVMGHGVRASLVVSMLRGLMEKERESATSPEWFLYGVNDGLVSIFERAGVTLFATAIYCVIDLKARNADSTPVRATRLLSWSGSAKANCCSRRTRSPTPLWVSFPRLCLPHTVVSLDEIDRLLIFTGRALHEVEDAAGEELGIERIVTIDGERAWKMTWKPGSTTLAGLRSPT